MKRIKNKSLNYFALLVITGLVFSCCKKPEQTNFYQSNGNVFILQVDEKLEAAYEFNLTNTTLVNDSLPLIYHTVSNGINQNTVLQFTPNLDTLLEISQSNITFFTNPIASENFQQLQNAIAFDSTFFQVIGNATNVDLASIWSKIAKLDIVKTYLNANPSAKIGIQKFIFNEYDPQLGFSVPNEKFLVFLVK
jgi:hypothetical protein